MIKKNYALWRRMSLPAAILVLASLGRGVQTDKYQANAVRTGGAVNVDGRLDEADWKIAPAAGNFIQTEPEEGRPATEATEVRILFDDRNIYFGVICHDSRPDQIVANEMRRDSELRNNDYFEVVLDTYNDHRNAFYFSVNPLGAQRDLLIRDEGANINREWDGIWVVRTQRTGEGWTAEIAIPFRTLRFNKDADQTWGVNFGRSVARKREESYWTPILRNYGFMGKMKISYFGHLTGLSGLKQGQKVQVAPYVIGGGNKEEAGAPFKGRADAGLDLKYRLTSNVTADLTVNTDFAQVEADQEQFNLTPYSLFFPEKREFFLEGADIFRFGERSREHEMPSTLLFFSRSIGLSEDGKEVPVLGGVKVTGKAGRYDLGVLDILTSRTSYLNDDDEHVNIGRANSSVFRIKRDIFEKSSVGIIGLSKDPLDGGEYNRATGLDFNLALGRSFKADGFLAKTFSPDLKGNDWAGALNTSFADDFWDFGLSYTDIGENFNAELGFVPRTDIRKLRLNAGVGPRPRFLGLRQSFFMNNLTYIEDHSGRLQNRDIFSGVWNLFAKAYVQWNGSEDLFKSNFLIRWIYKPGANIYFIYNETRKLVGGGEVEDRTVMLKASFLFNL